MTKKISKIIKMGFILELGLQSLYGMEHNNQKDTYTENPLFHGNHALSKKGPSNTLQTIQDSCALLRELREKIVTLKAYFEDGCFIKNSEGENDLFYTSKIEMLNLITEIHSYNPKESKYWAGYNSFSEKFEKNFPCYFEDKEIQKSIISTFEDNLVDLDQLMKTLDFEAATIYVQNERAQFKKNLNREKEYKQPFMDEQKEYNLDGSKNHQDWQKALNRDYKASAQKRIKASEEGNV